MELTFKDEIKDIDINGLNGFLNLDKSFDLDVQKSTATVEYDVQPELRSWGIESMNLVPRRVVYTLHWICDGEFLSADERAAVIATGATEMHDKTFEGYIEIDSREKLNGKEWQLKDEIEFAKDGGCQIVTVEFDFKKMTINLT